ncbi:MAG: PrgI family protein [bacterium]|nr:PrgI family protein [bacterium]
MPQFVVPQFIDVEDKIIGPITTRQFIIFLVDGFIIFILYKILVFVYFIVSGLFLFALGGVLAFLRVNGQPFHFFLLNFLQTSKKSKIRVWNKQKSDSELRVLSRTVAPPPVPPKPRKEPLTQSRLSEIALLLDTGGVYTPEE